MRGKVKDYNRLYSEVRITPAYAGKSLVCVIVRGLSRDHPRVCGEKQSETLTNARRTGSPPRMRGKVVVHSCVVAYLGITPAYAGKSIQYHVIVRPCWDHPRVCGEKIRVCDARDRATGSPPRMRGKVHFLPVRLCFLGITPAYAGKSSVLSQFRMSHRDHPRVCGEKTKKIP